MRKKYTRILLLEDSMADAGFLREALGELEELRNGNTWLSPFEICDAETLEEATLLLKDVSFDAILADLWLPDSNGIQTFQRLKAAAQQTPILVMLGSDDAALTVKLMQEGAQDVLVKHEVDCTPLGRAIRCAIERNRIATGLRRMSVRDEITGLLNFTGFVQLGEPYCRLLRRKGTTVPPAACAFFQITNLNAVSDLGGKQEEEWLLVELGEMMRAFSSEVDLMAYFGGGRFAILSPDRCGIVLHAALRRLAEEIRAKAMSRGTPVELQVQISAGELGEPNGWQLESLLDEVEECLWENRPFEKTCETEAQPVLQ
jgi:two-component system, cell cycle response regulator